MFFRSRSYLPKFFQLSLKPHFHGANMSANKTVLLPQHLCMLTCPINQYQTSIYTGVEAKVSSMGRQLELRWKGEFGYILLDRQDKQIKLVSESPLDWQYFNTYFSINKNFTTELLPTERKFKSRSDNYHLFPTNLLILVSPAIKLNLYTEDIVQSCNTFYRMGVKDWLLYAKIIVKQVEKVYEQKWPKTPFHDSAKVMGQDRARFKRFDEVGCIIAQIVEDASTEVKKSS